MFRSNSGKKYFIFNKATAYGYGRKMFHCKLRNVVVILFCMKTHKKSKKKSVTDIKPKSMIIRYTLQF